VPFASVTGTKRLLDIDPTSHGATATPRVQVFFNRPAFGRAEKSWEDLAGLVTNFTPFLEIATRVMHGLLGYDGDVYDAIKAADPFACLESCSVIYELFHHVSAPSVSKNWSISNSMSFQLGPNIREFTKNVPLLAAMVGSATAVVIDYIGLALQLSAFVISIAVLALVLLESPAPPPPVATRASGGRCLRGAPSSASSDGARRRLDCLDLIRPCHRGCSSLLLPSFASRHTGPLLPTPIVVQLIV
jgi:hypothetical protein